MLGRNTRFGWRRTGASRSPVNRLNSTDWSTKLRAAEERLPQRKESPISWGDLIERKIQEAQEEGLFDNLPGRGRPLVLAEHPFVKPGWQLAYRMLRNAGFVLDWIELDKSIRAELLQCPKLLEDQLAWASEALISSESEREIEAELDHAYRWTIATFKKRAELVNQRIELLNLKVPLISLQRQKIQIAEELDRFRASWRKRTELHTHSSASSSIPALDGEGDK